MNDELDRGVEAALHDTFARRDDEIGTVYGDLDDVYRRVARHRMQRRSLTAVAAIAIVAAGVGGLVGLGQLDSDASLGSVGGPTVAPTSVGGGDAEQAGRGYVFVCDGPIGEGSQVFERCDLEVTVAHRVWQCRGAVPGDDSRSRFTDCVATTPGATIPPQCVPVTAPPTTASGTTVPPRAITPPVELTCVTSGCPPTPTGPVTVPCASVPAPVPTIAYVEVCPPVASVPYTVPCASVPATSVPHSPTPTTAVVAGEQVHVVASGENPALIAARYGVTLDELVTYNGWSDAGVPFLVGDSVLIPPSDGAGESPQVIGIGDAVMLGASDVLQARGWTVVAQVNLQLADAVPIVQEMAARGVFTDTQTAVIHLGTNGTFTAEQLDALLAPLADVPNVLLYTVRADRTWTEPNNALLRAADKPDDNITVIDWATRSQECTGNCFAGDGIHVDQAGKQFFADLARDWTGR